MCLPDPVQYQHPGTSGGPTEHVSCQWSSEEAESFNTVESFCVLTDSTVQITSDCSASAVWSGSRSWAEPDEWEWSAVLNLTWLLLLSVIVLSEDNILPPSDEASIKASIIRWWFPRLHFTSALKHKLKAEIKDEEEDERSVTESLMLCVTQRFCCRSTLRPVYVMSHYICFMENHIRVRAKTRQCLKTNI